MRIRHLRYLLAVAAIPCTIGGVLELRPEFRPCWLGGNCGTTVAGNVFSALGGAAFTEVLIHGRTFIDGQVVTTVTHRMNDLTRQPILLDFNGDGKVDPVVGYNQNQKGIIQILLELRRSRARRSSTSLTLDGGENLWANLSRPRRRRHRWRREPRHRRGDA